MVLCVDVVVVVAVADAAVEARPDGPGTYHKLNLKLNACQS